MILNTMCLRCENYQLLSRYSVTTLTLVYLHGTGHMYCVVLLAYYIFDVSVGKQFYLLQREWMQNIQCKMYLALVLFITVFSTLTTLVIAAERYIVICHPFRAGVIFKQVFIPYNFYLIAQIIMMQPQLILFEPSDPLCLYFTSGKKLM